MAPRESWKTWSAWDVSLLPSCSRSAQSRGRGGTRYRTGRTRAGSGERVGVGGVLRYEHKRADLTLLPAPDRPRVGSTSVSHQDGRGPVGWWVGPILWGRVCRRPPRVAFSRTGPSLPRLPYVGGRDYRVSSPVGSRTVPGGPRYTWTSGRRHPYGTLTTQRVVTLWVRRHGLLPSIDENRPGPTGPRTLNPPDLSVDDGRRGRGLRMSVHRSKGLYRWQRTGTEGVVFGTGPLR